MKDHATLDQQFIFKRNFQEAKRQHKEGKQHLKQEKEAEMFKVDTEIKQKIVEMQDMKNDMQNVLY